MEREIASQQRRQPTICFTDPGKPDGVGEESAAARQLTIFFTDPGKPDGVEEK